MEDILINNRVCPMPMYWSEFYNLLVKAFPDKTILKPLILAAWNFSSNTEKQIRFKDQISLVDFNTENILSDYLILLSEDKWHHINNY